MAGQAESFDQFDRLQSVACCRDRLLQLGNRPGILHHSSTIDTSDGFGHDQLACGRFPEIVTERQLKQGSFLVGVAQEIEGPKAARYLNRSRLRISSTMSARNAAVFDALDRQIMSRPEGEFQFRPVVDNQAAKQLSQFPSRADTEGFQGPAISGCILRR